MAILVNSSGKIYTIGGKILTNTTAPKLATELQTLILPSGDQISIQATSDDLWLTSDLELGFIWENKVYGTYIHWGSSIDCDYLYEDNGEYLHIYEFDMYEHQNDSEWQDAAGDGAMEARYIEGYGRYLGTIAIDSAGYWLVESW